MSARETGGAGEGKFPPIEYSPLADQVYITLRKAILSGDLAAGERLVETNIAEEIGVSRAPVREAISRLEMEGLVDLRRRRGTHVSTLSKRDAWEVYTLRAALEGLAYRLAGERITEEGYEQLKHIVDDMEACVETKDRERLSELDTAFHKSVVAFTGHERLMAVWMSINGQIALLSQRVITKEYADLSTVNLRHKKLLEILRTGSSEEAARAIEEHIQSAAERVLAHFESDGDT